MRQLCGKSIIESVEEERAQRIRDEQKRPEFKARIDFWRSRGYVVARLVNVINGDMRAVETTFAAYERDIGRLSELQVRLNQTDIMGFPNDALAVRQKLTDPDAVPEIEQRLADLDARVAARKEEDKKRNAEAAKAERERRLGWYKQRIQSWADKGYSTRKLEGVTDSPDPAFIEKSLDAFDRDVRMLLELRKQLEIIDVTGSEEEARAIDKLLYDPEAMQDASDRINVLVRKHNARKGETEKRVTWRKMFDEYKLKGYKVARIEGAAEKPLSEAETLFQSYMEDVGVLFKLWDRLRALGRINFPDEWDAIKALMNDPDQLADISRRVEALEVIQKKKDADRAEEDRKLASGAREIMKDIFERMKTTVPDYLPLGSYIKDAKWQPMLSPDFNSIRGEVVSGLLSRESISVVVTMAPAVDRQMLVNEAENARMASKFVARCAVIVRASPEQAAMVKAFRHPNLSAFIHDLATGTVICNDEDLKTKLYADWFVKGASPKTMKDAVKSVSDKHGIFTRASLAEKLAMAPREVEEMLNGWLSRNEVILVSKIRDEYSFMD